MTRSRGWGLVVDAPLVEGCCVSGTGFGRGVRRDAVARVVAGESASAVARDLGCCRGSVSLWCQEVGVELVGGRRGGTVQRDQARRARVVQAVLAGATLTRAGAAAGVSRDSARRYWHDQAVESAATAPRRSSGRSSGRRDWSVSACSGRVGRGQRVSDENTNRLIRDYLPKGTSFTTITDTQVQAIQDRLNRRPRIVLNGQTPTEKLNDIINGANTT